MKSASEESTPGAAESFPARRSRRRGRRTGRPRICRICGERLYPAVHAGARMRLGASTRTVIPMSTNRAGPLSNAHPVEGPTSLISVWNTAPAEIRAGSLYERALLREQLARLAGAPARGPSLPKMHFASWLVLIPPILVTPPYSRFLASVRHKPTESRTKWRFPAVRNSFV